MKLLSLDTNSLAICMMHHGLLMKPTRGGLALQRCPFLGIESVQRALSGAQAQILAGL